MNILNYYTMTFEKSAVVDGYNYSRFYKQHHAINNKYDTDRVKQMWNSIAFNDCREFAFFDGIKWYHPKIYFSCDSFYDYLCSNAISDVHVKPLPNDGGREWVIDVDFKDTDENVLNFKIDLAKRIFVHFFGSDGIARIMHSGNRGIHVWLKINKFRMNADKAVRCRYYKVFVKPKASIELNRIENGSFIHSIKTVLETDDIRAMIKKLYDNNKNEFDIKELLKEFWPPVDQHVFCNLNQIRVPFSYNFKGKKYSYLLH
ncbi:lef1 [Hemileuca sp. nucleopolyhedrovirus]|uniref:Lef1 n=1 Tax=Hemileuca sp. nucleopolyhedrovirus TaxID=1367203 RepID=S5N9F7_9ABAC|nr:lef1 [Hemileuca sp. nucleopolyhedrovirus]AGR56887.1 lef1 [Hemileuca sp. nucleopolyhedrovirus]